MTPNERLAEVFERGFKVTDAGAVLKPDGSTQPVGKDKHGYWRFSAKGSDGKIRQVMVGRLAAYQKYGEQLFADGIEVRHENGDEADNRLGNVLIGTKSQNALDKDPEVRRAVSAGAARKLTDDQVRQLREERARGTKYADLAQKYGIQKSTVSYIVRGITCT